MVFDDDNAGIDPGDDFRQWQQEPRQEDQPSQVRVQQHQLQELHQAQRNQPSQQQTQQRGLARQQQQQQQSHQLFRIQQQQRQEQISRPQWQQQQKKTSQLQQLQQQHHHLQQQQKKQQQRKRQQQQKQASQLQNEQQQQHLSQQQQQNAALAHTNTDRHPPNSMANALSCKAAIGDQPAVERKVACWRNHIQTTEVYKGWQKVAHAIMIMTDLANRGRGEGGAYETPEDFIKHEHPYADVFTEEGCRPQLLASEEMICREILRREPHNQQVHRRHGRGRSMHFLMTILAQCPLQEEDEVVNQTRRNDVTLRRLLEKQLRDRRAAIAGRDRNDTTPGGTTPGIAAPRERPDPAGGPGMGSPRLADPGRIAPPRNADHDPAEAAESSAAEGAAGRPIPRPSFDRRPRHPDDTTRSPDPSRPGSVAVPQSEAKKEERPTSDENAVRRHYEDCIPGDQKMSYIVMMMTDLANVARLEEDKPCHTPEDFVKQEHLFSAFLARKNVKRKKVLASKCAIWQEICRRAGEGERRSLGLNAYKTKSVPKLMTMLANCPIRGDDDMYFVKQTYALFRGYLEKEEFPEQQVRARSNSVKHANENNTTSGGKSLGAAFSQKTPGSAAKHITPLTDATHDVGPGADSTETAREASAAEYSPPLPSAAQHRQHPNQKIMSSNFLGQYSVALPNSEVAPLTDATHDISSGADLMEAETADAASPARDALTVEHSSSLPSADRKRQHLDKKIISSNILGRYSAVPPQSEAERENRPMVEESTTLYDHYRDQIPPNQKLAYIVMMMTDLANIERLKEAESCQTPKDFVKKDRLYSTLLTRNDIKKKNLLPPLKMIWQEILRREPKEAQICKGGRPCLLDPYGKDSNTKLRGKSSFQLISKLAKYPIQEQESIRFIKEEHTRFRSDLQKQLDAVAKVDDAHASQGKEPGSTKPRKRSASADSSRKSKKTTSNTKPGAPTGDVTRAAVGVIDPLEAAFAGFDIQWEALREQKWRLEMKLWEGDNDEQMQDLLRNRIKHQEKLLEQIGLRATNLFLGLDDVITKE